LKFRGSLRLYVPLIVSFSFLMRKSTKTTIWIY